MSSSIDVYWADELPSFCTPILRNPVLNKALSVMSLEKEDMALISKCPSWRDYYSNTFVINSPVDITIESDGNGFFSVSSPVSNENISRAFQYMTKNLQQLLLPDMFFCEESLVVEQLRPLLVESSVHENIEMIQGSFDIGSWLRVMAFGFKTKEGFPTTIKIKHDQPLYFLKFNTKKTVNIKRFKPSERLLKIVHDVFRVKDSQNHLYGSLNNYYELFRKRNLKKEIIKEIKSNLE